MLTAIFAVLSAVLLLLWLNAKGAATLRFRAHQEDRAALLEQLARESKLAQHRFEILDGVIGERDQAFKMYQSIARGSANAQAWLFRELEGTVRALNAELHAQGKPLVRLPKELEECVRRASSDAAGIQDPEPAAEIVSRAKEPPPDPQGSEASPG